MIPIWIICTAILILISHILLRDYASPVLILGIIWIFVYINLYYHQQYIDSQAPVSYFFISYLFYYIGFFISMRWIDQNAILAVHAITCDVSWKPKFPKWILITEYAISIFYIAICYSNIRSMAMSLWRVFRTTLSENSALSSGLPSVMRIAIQMVFLVAFAFCLLNPTKNNRKVLICSIPPLFITLLFDSRGGWFLILIACVYMYILIRRPRGMKIVLIGVLGIIFVFAVFLISSFDKYSNAYLWETNKEKFSRIVNGYFVAPPISFLSWINTNIIPTNGKNTFRFICALLHPFFPDIEVVSTVQPFINYTGYNSNVYTALHWYASDYGFWWTCVVELFLGIVYGKLYREVRMNNKVSIFAILMSSMLMFPLINQFFDEKIFSVFSMWVQRAFWIFVVLKLSIIRYSNLETEKNKA